ncbi:hypothetical protein [Leptospira licerasiae]|uniref:Uncharacterized protein n=1 Tax=Leptospira licerasiae str. MMD4847 TaxID=1049971 RepID=A0ABN0H9T9_9LEPT|nr:hypothetical protein [Leptospira licerasiae]EIE01496.1 hypothetical protein LEP1GSC185_3942 [Leptospira licerasiae serovar Varillal str. VAR 010]EJZ42279.1 hypothetical protein LEP1GSC178_0011 [Leptospira licerasiae str. MMD4847]
MNESIEIKAKVKPDLNNFDKEFDRISKRGKKGIDVKIRPPKEKSKSAKKKKENLSSYYSSGSSAGSNTIAVGSDLDETQRGGFAGVIERKLSAYKEIREKFKKKEKNEDSSEYKFGTENGLGSLGKSGLSSGKIDKAEIKIQTAHFDKIGSGFGNFGGRSDPNNPGSQVGGGGQGDRLSTIGQALPYIGAGIAIAGGIAKIVSAVGEQYTAAMQSQASTYGATGRYIGGGGGLFANAEVAQSNLARGRITGESIYGKGNLADEEIMRFSASQGKSLNEIVTQLETIRKENKNLDIGYLRGGANATGFSNLRQSEYISKLAQISENLRGRGYSGETEGFTRFAAGITRESGSMDPSRRLSLADELSNQGRQGVFGGGITGALSMAEAIKANKGDFFAAMRESEKDPGKYVSSALNSLDPLTRGILGKMEGRSFTESENLKFSQNNFGRDNSPIQAGENKVTYLDNLKKEEFAAYGGGAAQIGYDLNKAMLDLFKDNQAVFNKVVDGIKVLENISLPLIAGTINGLRATLEMAVGGISSLKDAVIQSAMGGNTLKIKSR